MSKRLVLCGRKAVIQFEGREVAPRGSWRWMLRWLGVPGSRVSGVVCVRCWQRLLDARVLSRVEWEWVSLQNVGRSGGGVGCRMKVWR